MQRHYDSTAERSGTWVIEENDVVVVAKVEENFVKIVGR